MLYTFLKMVALKLARKMGETGPRERCAIKFIVFSIKCYHLEHKEIVLWSI